MPSRLQARILLVEDDPLESRRLHSALQHLGHDVVTAADGDEALSLLNREAFDCVLLDLVIPGLDGLGVLSRLAAERRAVPVIAAVTATGLESAATAIRAGARDFVVKPAGALRLQVAIRNALAFRPTPAPQLPDPVAAPEPTGLLDDAGHARPLAQIEADAIRFAVTHYGGRMSEVARRLGIGRSTLYRKLTHLGLPVPDHCTALPVAAE